MVVSTVFIPVMAFLIAVLFLNVSRLRIKNKISLGDGDNKDLRNAMRAHGNATETIPIFGLLMLLFEFKSSEHQTFLIAIACLFAIARLLHVIGMIFYKFPMRFRIRQAGAALTLISIITLAIGCLK